MGSLKATLPLLALNSYMNNRGGDVNAMEQARVRGLVIIEHVLQVF